MRNIWDEQKRIIKRQKESAVFSRPRKLFSKHTEKGLAKTKERLLEHLELREAIMDFFPDYQRYLGEGGFIKI